MQIDLYREKFMSVPSKHVFQNGFQTKYYAEDPLFNVFSLFFEFDSPFLNPADGKGESAERYFRSMGDDKRMKKVSEFRERLLHLVDQTPYLMKSINGLSDLYDYNNKAIYIDREIKVDTYETVDFRIAKLAELYTDIVWDFDHQKRILPTNLEWINYHIISNDIRQLVTFIESNDGTSSDNITAFMDSFVLSFKNARLSFTKSNSFLSNISNEEPVITNNSFMMVGGKFSKKKNRITLTNEEKSSNVTKITGERSTKPNNEIEKISLKKILKKVAVDYLRQEASQLANEFILSPLKSSLFDLLAENSFYPTLAPDLSKLITGKQSIGDVIPDFGSSDTRIRDRILNKDKLDFIDKADGLGESNDLINIQGMSNEELINIILNDVNKRLVYKA